MHVYWVDVVKGHWDEAIRATQNNIEPYPENGAFVAIAAFGNLNGDASTSAYSCEFNRCLQQLRCSNELAQSFGVSSRREALALAVITYGAAQKSGIYISVHWFI